MITLGHRGLTSQPYLAGVAGLLLFLFARIACELFFCSSRGMVRPRAAAPGYWLGDAGETRVVMTWRPPRDGTLDIPVWVDKEQFDLEHLDQALDSVPIDRPVFLVADARLPVGPVRKVLEGLGRRGHDRVFLAAELGPDAPPGLVTLLRWRWLRGRAVASE